MGGAGERAGTSGEVVEAGLRSGVSMAAMAKGVAAMMHVCGWEICIHCGVSVGIQNSYQAKMSLPALVLNITGVADGESIKT